jgi:hypothetical protein
MWEILILGAVFIGLAVGIVFLLAILLAYASQVAYIDPLDEGLDDD